jgi:hypothetical protein
VWVAYTRTNAERVLFSQHRGPDMSYARFGLMIITSTLVMLVLMYLNTFSLDHVSSSQTRTWMDGRSHACVHVVDVSG